MAERDDGQRSVERHAALPGEEAPSALGKERDRDTDMGRVTHRIQNTMRWKGAGRATIRDLVHDQIVTAERLREAIETVLADGGASRFAIADGYELDLSAAMSGFSKAAETLADPAADAELKRVMACLAILGARPVKVSDVNPAALIPLSRTDELRCASVPRCDGRRRQRQSGG